MKEPWRYTWPLVRVLFASFLSALPFACCSCSLLLVKVCTKDASRSLSTGRSREELIAAIGQPERTVTKSAQGAELALPKGFTSPISVCIYDEHHVSGLVLTGQDWYTSNLVGLPWVFTCGLFEAFALPYVSVDLVKRSFQRRKLRVWYDCDQRQITYRRIKRRERPKGTRLKAPSVWPKVGFL
jgi:hypothetical protein